MTAPTDARRREVARLLHDAAHQARARHLSREQVEWIRRLLVQALEIVGQKEERE